jgi:hypothetical protein
MALTEEGESTGCGCSAPQIRVVAPPTPQGLRGVVDHLRPGRRHPQGTSTSLGPDPKAGMELRNGAALSDRLAYRF